MPKSRNDYIREELEKNFDAPAAAIVDRVTKKGHRCAAQHVYQLRSMLRHSQGRIREQQVATLAAARQTREENATSLGQHILNILTAHPEGLSYRDLVVAVWKAGYSSRASDFLTVVRQKLYDMVEKGHIAKNGLQYKLQGSALEKAQDDADASRKRETMAKVEVALSDYALLREAVVDLAKAKGFANPDVFPDILITQRREFIQVQKQYFTLFEAGSTNGIVK